MKTILAAILFVGLCVLGLGVNVFFRKGGKFPETDISRNPRMRELGIKCAKEEELERLRRESGKTLCEGRGEDACRSCALFGKDH